MTKIGFIGFGDLGKQIYSMLIDRGYKHDCFLFFDDNIVHDQIQNFSFKEYEKSDFDSIDFIICLGYKHLLYKKDILKKLKEQNRKLFTFIHPTSFVNKSAEIGEGVIIYPMCNIDMNVTIKEGVLVNNSVTISHDSIIGRASFLAPSVTICGKTQMGEACFVGAGSIISNNINIGNNSVIGIGSCVNKDIPENSYAVGNPFRLVKSISLK